MNKNKSANEKNILLENEALEPRIMFKIIQQEGEIELNRSFRALAFSAECNFLLKIR